MLEEHLDQLDEQQDAAETQVSLNKRRTKRYFNQRAKPEAFKIGNLVLRETGTTMQEEEKLGLCCEGPYVVVVSTRPGLYNLKDTQGKELTDSWNTKHLKRYYP